MPESATTIDCIQVEFSTNLDEMVRDLSDIEGLLDDLLGWRKKPVGTVNEHLMR